MECPRPVAENGIAIEARDVAHEDRVHHAVALVFLSLWGAMVFNFLSILWSEWKRYQEKDLASSQRFTLYLKYRFGHWYAWTSYSSVLVLCVLSATLLVIGGCLHSVLAAAPVSDSLWAAWIWIAAPDGGNSAQPGGYVVGMLVSIGGMLIFALLVSIITAVFEDHLWHLRHGSIPVVEGDHIVILGWTPLTPVILEELCIARESSGGCVIVLLTKESKPDVESMLQREQDRGELTLRNSSIVVRTGNMHFKDDLYRVAVPSAQRVLVLASSDSSREQADSHTLNTLLMLHGLLDSGCREGDSSPKKDRRKSCAIVECCLVRNQTVFQNLAGDVQMEVLTVQDFVGQLMVECSRQRGLSSIITETIGFDGDEFYIAGVKGLKGWKFQDVLFAFPQAICVGIVIPAGGDDADADDDYAHNEVKLLPGMDVELRGNEQLVLLAEDRASIPVKVGTECLQNVKKFGERKSAADCHVRQEDHAKQLVVILGWNECIDSILTELDHLVGAGSNVMIYSPKPDEERKDFLTASQRRRKYIYRKINIHHCVGSLGARYKLEELPFEKAEKIFILADSTAASPADADGMTVAAVLQIRDILISRIAVISSKQVIVPQVLSRAAEEACFKAGLTDCIDSNRLSARVLASVCEAPALSAVWDQFLSESTGALFRIRTADEYASELVQIPAEVCFYDVLQAAAAAGDVAIGWSKPEACDQSKNDFWEMNPKDKSKLRCWGPGSLIAVLACSRVQKDGTPGSRWSKVSNSVRSAVRFGIDRRGSKESLSSETSNRTLGRRPSLLFPNASGALSEWSKEVSENSIASVHETASPHSQPGYVLQTSTLLDGSSKTVVTPRDPTPSNNMSRPDGDRANFMDSLGKLVEFRAQGILMEEEFQAAKKRLLEMGS